MAIGILTAIPQEKQALAAALGATGDGVLRGVLGGIDVVVADCGVGKVNAAAATALMIERYDPDAIVFTGVAGGLDPTLSVGDVVIGETVIQHDAGVFGGSGLETYQAGHIPFFNPTDQLGFSPSQQLLDRCRSQLKGFTLPGFGGGNARIVFGTILTGDHYLADEEERARLFREFGAQAIEMEGGATAQIASAHGVECLVIRSLSDLSGADSHIDFGSFLDHAASTAVATLKQLLPALA